MFVLTGCASNPKKTGPGFSELYISYRPTSYAVVNTFGQNTSSSLMFLTGLLGPVGSLVGAGITLAANKAAVESIDERSKKFDEKVKTDSSNYDINLVQAELIADKIKKVSDISVTLLLPGQEKDIVLKDGQAILSLNTVTGYGTAEAMSSFAPVVVTDYLLKVGMTCSPN